MTLEYDFEASIGYWLIRASMAYERALNNELAPRGITFRQTQVLGWLALEKELTQSDLAERMHIEPPTLVGILDRMERDGWISRHDCPTDRRKKLIRTCPQAEPVWAEMVACARRVRARVASKLKPRQLSQLRQLLEDVLDALADETPEREPAPEQEVVGR